MTRSSSRSFQGTPRARLAALGGAALLALAAPALLGCQPVKLPHHQPGPPGCGNRDPRDTAPAMLSNAQQKVLRDQGSPGEVRQAPSASGGVKDWVYHRSTGSVFGEQQTVQWYRFDKDGLLVASDTELLRKVGK